MVLYTQKYIGTWDECKRMYKGISEGGFEPGPECGHAGSI